MPGHQMKWMSREDPRLPCHTLGSDFAVLYHCYHRPEMVPVCFDSFGRDAATQTLRDPVRILALCDKAPRDRGLYAACLAGAVPVITDFWGPNLRDQATELCRRAPADGKPACYTTLHNRVVDLFNLPAERQRICDGFEAPFRKHCDHS